MAGSWIRPERRLAIYIRDEFTCCYCGRNLKNYDPSDITLDHLMARHTSACNGEKHDHSNTNLVTACRSCNSSRQDRPWMDYATGGARERIETRRYQEVNVKLAKSILSNEIETLVADVENLRA